MAAKDALFAVCQTLFPAPIQVVFGRPGTDLEDDIVAVGDTRVDYVRAGQVEQRREEVTVTFSAYRGGGEEVQQTVTDRVYALKDSLVSALRADGTMGGAVLSTRLTEADLAEVSDPDLMALGRVAELRATIIAVAGARWVLAS